MEPPLPLPSQLPSEGQWLELRRPVSEPSTPNGDWRAFPHMSSGHLWRQLMGDRVAEFLDFLKRFDIWPSECLICKAAGRGHCSGFGEHVAGHTHFKEMGRVLPDGMRVADVRGGLWQGMNVPGGAIRFNHADGVIEMCKGQPDSSRPSIAAPGQLALAAPVATHTGPGDMPDVASLELEGQWIPLSEPIGQPLVTNGDFNQCPFLQCKSAWKNAAAAFPRRLCRYLERYRIYPMCPFCPNAKDFESHIPAQMHYQKLLEHLTPGEPVVQAASRMWQKWNVPGGAVRLNHVHGKIELWKGPPPPEGEYLSLTAAPRKHVCEPSPAAAMQLQARPAAPCALPAKNPVGYNASYAAPPGQAPPPVAPGWEGYKPSHAPSSYAPSPSPQPPLPSWEPEHEQGQGRSSEAIVAGKRLCAWLWRQQFGEQARRAERLLKHVPSVHCQACGRPMAEGVAAHLLSEEHIENVAMAADLAKKDGDFKQTFNLPNGSEIVLEHFPLSVRDEANGAVPGKLQWRKLEDRWVRSDGVSFNEEDPAWERFLDPCRGSYYYCHKTGNYFFVETGEDMGVW